MKRLVFTLLPLLGAGCSSLTNAPGLWLSDAPPLPVAAAGWSGGPAADGSLHAYRTVPWAPASPVQRADESNGEPRVDAGRIAWNDRRNDDDDVFVIDLASGAETRIDDSTADQYGPDIDGDWVVFNDERNASTDVFAWSLSSGMLVAVATGPGRQSNPVVSNGRVCWEHDPTTTSQWAEIWCRVLGVGTAMQIAPAGSPTKRNPALDGDVLVWENNTGHIRGWNFATGAPLTITTENSSGPGGHQLPDVAAGRVAWQSDNGQWDIFVQEIATGVTTRLTYDSSTQQTDARISSNLVVWIDHAGDNLNIQGYDLVRRVHVPIAMVPGTNLITPDVDGDDIVFTDSATLLFTTRQPEPPDDAGLFALAPNATTWMREAEPAYPFSSSATTMFEGALVECGIATAAPEILCARWDAGADSWIRSSHAPTGFAGSSRALAAAVDGYVYLITATSVSRWIPATDEWTDVAPVTIGIDSAVAAVHRGRLHVFDFANNQDAVFDPFQNTWTGQALDPTSGVCPAVAAANGDLYIVTGTDELGRMDVGGKRTRYRKTAKLPTPRFNACPVSDGARVFVLGGYSDGTLAEAVDVVDIFVP